ncbi:MAG: hypothetical protein V1712_01855 [Patescibacteria group bacterium]
MFFFYNLLPKFKKTVLIVFSLFFVFSSVYSLFNSLPAQAQVGPLPTVEVTPMPTVELGLSIWDRLWQITQWAWEHGGAIAYRNAIRTFTSRIAYDSAVYLGSGGKGQKPLFVTKNWGAYLKDVGDSAAGDFLETLAQENGYIKFGLCEPVGLGFQAPQAKLIIGLTLFDEIKPRKPKCSLSDMQRNWKEALSDPKRFLKNYNIVFDPKQHDLGVTLRLKQTIIVEEEAQKKIKEAEILANKGLKSLTEPIAGGIKTPAVFLEKQFGIGLESASNEPLQVTGDAIADALGVFTNTLANKLMKNLFQKGLVPNPSAGRSPGGPSPYFPPSYGVEYAMQVNSSISTPQFVVDKNFDIIQELSSCPDMRYASVNNCTIDSKFEQLLRKASEGAALSVGDMINSKEWGYLGGWLLEKDRPRDSKTPIAWYLSDLQKMRRARIIPVGWELAAEKFGGKGVTLKQAVDGFAQVGKDNKCGTAKWEEDGESRYCGLIDPNWIIRAPASQCRVQGPGQMLQEGGTRKDTCVDEEQCVAEDEDGNCQSWGYCLAEKNIWRFSGDSCEFPAGSGYSPFATCQTFESTAGDQLSVLTNSLENYNDGVCASAAGCGWYSRTLNPQESTGSVSRYQSDEANRFYLKNVDKYSCNASEQGCTVLLRLANIDAAAVAAAAGDNPAEKLVTKVLSDGATTEAAYSAYAKVNNMYLKQAPEYLNCYDTDAAGLANTSNDSEQCKNYLKWCSKYEVGCELYSSANGSPAVPAIIQPEDFCPDQCVGFNSFVQASSFFEPTPPPSVNFIPATAKTCPAQAAGCEEFTNIERSPSGEQKEYYVKLRQCILLDDPSAATYFTWVGSDLTGFQLKTWRLQKDPVDDVPFAATGECRELPDLKFPTNNPDCKQFYSLNGTISYRLASDVVTASNACSKYRATNVIEADCVSTGGGWDSGLNACIYNAVPNEGIKCEAASNGCREYKGPTANNIQLVFPVSTFGDQEQVEGQPIDATPASGWGSGENSNESLNAFGHSFASGINNAVTRYIKQGINREHRYLISFWAKHYDHATTVVTEPMPADTFSLDAAIDSLSDDWRFYKIEKTITASDNVDNGVFLIISATQQFVIDNIVMRDLSDTFYVIKNSWDTPSICGNEYLGCSVYADRSGKNVTLTSFNQLCRPEAIGCEPIVNTQNSNTPQATTTVVGAPAADIITPADSIVYRVYDSAKACADKAEACRLVGQPALGVSGEVTSWSDKFVRLDPDNFEVNNPASPLCAKVQDRCQNFTSNKATATFKDPVNSVCEYKQSGAIAEYNWYKKGTSEPCNYLVNPSFEKIEDHGDNLVSGGEFEGTLFDWKITAVPVTDWSISDPGQSEPAFLGKTSAKHTGNVSALSQKIRFSPGQAYTARVQVFSPTGYQRSLRIYGCGVDITDTTQIVNTWEKLQLTFTPTTSLCTLELSALDEAYFDSVSIYKAEKFDGWNRNGDATADNKLVTLSAVNSVPGQYWGSQVMEIESSSQQYSGIWSDDIDLQKVSSVDEENIRYFTVSAYFYVPDIPQNSGMIDWWLDVHATPPDPATPRKSCGGSWRQNYCQTDNDCPIGITCMSYYAGWYHYSVESGTDFIISAADKGKWQYKRLTIKIDPKVEFLSVGIMTNIINPCTADACKPNQVIYVDQVSIVEGAIQPAYLCSQEQSGCTGFYDPALTKQTYYYLNNDNLDKKSCAGQVSEKGGCLLFTDNSSSFLKWSANASYAKSSQQGGAAVSPISSQVCGEAPKCLTAGIDWYCSNNPAKSCTDATVTTDCGAAPTCTASSAKYCSNNPTATCDNANGCLSGVSCQNIKTEWYCENKPSFTCDPTAIPELCALKGLGPCIESSPSGTCSNNPTKVCQNNMPANLISSCGISCNPNPAKYCSNNIGQPCNNESECPPAPTCRNAATTKYCSNNSSKICTDATVTQDCGKAACLSGDLDTNVILKVRRDRVCGEWASCLSSANQYDPPSNSIKSICYALGRCASYGEQGAGKCGDWKIINNPKALTYENYITRDTNWSSYDFSGYSIPGQYPLDTLSQKNYSSDPEKSDIRLTRINPIVKACVGGVDDGKSCSDNSDCSEPNACKFTLRCGGTSDVECSVLYSAAAPCLPNSICQYRDLGITGAGPGAVKENYPATVPKLCRVYPKDNSPFPSYLASFEPGDPTTVVNGGSIKSKQQPYQDANICQDKDAGGKEQDCECNYQQVTYSMSENRFYSVDSDAPGEILVDEGEDINSARDPDDVYSKSKQENLFLGLKGYCLEQDKTRPINGGRGNPCLTWLPLDVVSGELSLYDYAPDAGFNNPSIAYYCAASADGHPLTRTSNVWEEPLCRYVISHGYEMPVPVKSEWPDIYKSQIAAIYIHFDMYSQVACPPGNYHVQKGYLHRDNNWEYMGGVDSIKNLPKTKLVKEQLCSRNANDPDCSFYWWDNSDNFVVATAVFNDQDRFLGVNLGASAIGVSDYISIGGTALIKVYLKELCTAVYQVAQGDANKAWTNRVLFDSRYAVAPEDGLGFTRERQSAPYGRLSSLPQNQLVISDIGNKEVTFDGTKYTTITTPYACTDGGCGPLPGICINGKDNNDKYTFDKPCTSSVDCGTDGVCSGYFSGICLDGKRKGLNCITNTDCPGSSCINYRTISDIDIKPAQKRIQSLFAKMYGLFTWLDGKRWVEQQVPLTPGKIDISDSAIGELCSLITTPSCALERQVPAPPSVKQVVFDSNSKPAAGADGFSIKTSTGLFASGNIEVVSPAAASALFYAYNPNGEQMPLTEVRVDWTGTPSVSAGSTGKYKNHKHLCAPQKVTTACGQFSGYSSYSSLGKGCTTDNDCAVIVGACTDRICDATAGAKQGYACGNSITKRGEEGLVPGDAACGGVVGSCKSVGEVENQAYTFGDSKDACIDDLGSNQGYFSFTRVLTCPAGGEGLRSCNSSDPNPADKDVGEVCWNRNALAGEGACEYRPRVYVEDNWEWCTSNISSVTNWGNACSVNSPGAWLKFDNGIGKILVRP